MSFQGQAADSGAELTSLKKNTELLQEESAGSSLDLVGLTRGKGKEKEEDFSYEPVRYAAQGAQPESGSGAASTERTEMVQPKRFGGSSMARNVVEEPTGQAFSMAGFKKDAPITSKRLTNDGDAVLSKMSGGSGEPAGSDKKMPLRNEVTSFTQPLPSGDSGLVVEKSKFEAGSAAQMGSELKLKSAGSAVDLGGSAMINTQLPADRGAATTEKLTGTAGRSQSLEQGIGNGAFATTLNQPADAALSKPAIQTQIPAAVDQLQFSQARFNTPGDLKTNTFGAEQTEARKVLPNGQQQFVESGLKQPAEIQQINRAAVVASESGNQTAFIKPALTQTTLNQTELPRPEVQQYRTQSLKPDQGGLRTETVNNRVSALSDMYALRKQELTNSTVRGGTLAAIERAPSNDFAPYSVRKLTQGSEIGVQSGSLRSGLTNIRPALAETAAELPRGFNRANAQLAQSEKFTPDVQLRAQAERIAAGAQVRALAEQPAANNGIKLKGEVAVNNVVPASVKTQDVAIANNGRPQDIAVGANIKAHDGVVAHNIKLQDALLPSGIRHQDIVAPVKVGQQFEASMQPRFSPLTGKSTQDLVQALRPQDRIAAARTSGVDLTPISDRRNAASVIRTGADALTAPVVVDRNVPGGNAHIISGDVKVAAADRTFTGDKIFTAKMNAGTTTGDVIAADRKPISATQLIALLANLKEGRENISRTPAFDPLMAGTLKSTADRYVGGEFLLASMIIAAGAARRMPEQRANAHVQGQAEGAQSKRGDKSVIALPQISDASTQAKTVKSSAFTQIVDIIAKAFTSGRNNDQQASLESSRRAHETKQIGQQTDSVRYITGVELAILLAAGGVSRLRSDKVEAQSVAQRQNSTQIQTDAAVKTTKDIATHSVSPVPFMPTVRIADQKALQNTTGNSEKTGRQPADLVVRAERCIPGAEVAVAAMLMLGGISKKRSEERFPANPNELAEKVDRSFRVDRTIVRTGLGEAIAQVKSFVAREPMPVSGLRATAADIVSRGEVVVPPQYKQGGHSAQNAQNSDIALVPQQNRSAQDTSTAQKSKPLPEIIAALPAPTGWVHEQSTLEKSADEASEEKLKKVEQDQQEGAGTGASQTLYRPIWIIAPGETFVSIAEDQFGDGSIAWLIADLNVGKFSESFVEGKRVIEIQSRQRIELPVAGDIEEFRHNRKGHMDAENIVTIVMASQLDLELKQATFRQFLGTLQSKLPVPAIAQLPELDLGTASQPRPLRPVAPFGMTAPQFASIAAAVSLPLILPQVDMMQSPTDINSAHVQEMRTAGETAKQEEQI